MTFGRAPRRTKESDPGPFDPLRGASLGLSDRVPSTLWLSRRSELTYMKVGRTVLEESVVLSFAEAEFTSPRHRAEVAAWVRTVDPNRLLNSEPSTWTDQDRRAATEAVRRYRGPILGELLALQPTWYEATITSDELPSLRPISFQPFDAIAPDRNLGTLAAVMDSGKETPGDGFSAGYRVLRSEFDLAKIRGRPSVVAADRSGPLVVFEGLTRLAIMASHLAHREAVPDTIDLYLGTTHRAPEWRFFGSP